MAKQVVFPASGATVLDEDGNLIPVTGFGPVETGVGYYFEKLRQGVLLTRDPLSVNGHPQPAVYAPVTLGTVTAQLATTPGARDLQYIETQGFASNGDEGGAQFQFRLGVSSGSDAYQAINCSNGQWQMVWDGFRADVRWFGVKADGLTASAAANQTGLEAALAALPSNGGILELPTGRIHHSETLVVPPFVTLRGASGVATGGSPATQLYMYRAVNPADRDTITQVAPQTGSVVESLGLGSILGRLHSLIGYDYYAEYGPLTGAVVRDCQLGCNNILNQAEADWGISINTLTDAPGNIERLYFENVSITNPRLGFCRVGNRGAQPTNIVWDRTGWSQSRAADYLGHPGNTPYGYGVSCSNSLCFMTFNSPAMNAIGIFVWQANGEMAVSINDADSEYVKMLVGSNGGFSGGSSPCTIYRGRFAVAGYPGVAAYDENDNVLVAAASQDWIYDLLSRPITLIGANASVNADPSSLRIRVAYGTSLTVEGCVLGNVNPVFREPAFGSEKIGGTYITASRALTAPGVVDKIPDRHGPESYDGVVTITGAATTQAIVFSNTEASANYRVYFTLLSETGAVAAGSRAGTWATLKTTAGCLANVPTAPGGITSVTFAYRLELEP